MGEWVSWEVSCYNIYSSAGSGYSDLPLMCPIALWSKIEGRGCWTGPIVSRGEGVIGVRWLMLLEGGLPLWMEWEERRAEESQPLGMRGKVWGLNKSGPLHGLDDCQTKLTRNPVQDLFVRVKLDGFSWTCDAVYLCDPVPTQYPPVAKTLWCDTMKNTFTATWQDNCGQHNDHKTTNSWMILGFKKIFFVFLHKHLRSI